MDPVSVTLSQADRLILESYKSLAEGLSNYLGSSYEIVLHSLESLDHSVIKIFNGYHTGRREGAPITDLALDMLSRIKESSAAPYISYFTKNKKNEPLKSTTIAIHGERGRIIGLLCMNCYLNTPLSDFIQNLIPRQPQATQAVSETFADTSGDMIEDTVRQVRDQVAASPQVPPHAKNRVIITTLYEKGIFNLKDAVVRTANVLGISKNTVYLHLRNLSA